MSSEDLSPAEQIEKFVRTNPDADPVEVLGQLGLSPDYRERVEQALGDGRDGGGEGSLNQHSGGESGGVLVNGSGDENRQEEPDSPDAEPGVNADVSRSSGQSWDATEFTTPETDVYPTPWDEREQWMCHTPGDKKPFAPWGDRDHPDADPDDDARWKWGLVDNYADLDTARDWGRKDPTLAGVVYLLREAEHEPHAFVDGDDVRCPDTGEVHPAFVEVLEELGLTYADVSVSGSGVHALYAGDLPDGVKEATFAIDTEPWGANDDVPEVEIYDHKHVCVSTGEHVPGTPTDIHEWDDDALEAILDEYEQLPEAPPEDPAAEREVFDATDYEPDVTSSDEITTDVRDIFAALDRLDAQRVAARTIVHQWNDDASTSDGERAFVPTWGRRANGTANIVNDKRWQDTGGGGYGGAVVMALIDAGEVRPRSATPRVSGETWWKGVEHLRELGFDIPEYDPPTDDVDHTAVLPPAVRELSSAASGWDWRRDGRDEDALTVSEARERTVEAIAEAYESYDHVLVEALPTMGKSYGAVRAARETGEPVTILTGRGRKEQYAQFKEWAKEHGLEVYELPAFTHHCDTANGEHGQEWAETVRDWYHRGVTPKEIHKSAEYVLGEPLPCQRHEEQDCPYTSKWDFDPDEKDILLGHYTHAHKSKVTAGRSVVFDEFPDAYEESLVVMESAISYWLSTVDAIPFENYADLRDNRDDEQRRADALLWFDEHGVEPDENHVFDDSKAHADAPLAVFTLLAGEDLGNGFEQADLGETGVGVYNRESDEVSVLRPPPLTDAPPSRKPSAIVALDGTPTKRMWELALGERLTHRPVLQEGERAEYIDDALNLNFVRTTEYVKSYNSSEHVSVAKDSALLEAIADEHGQRPSLITTATAEEEFDAAGVLDLVDETKHYGNVLGSNQFDETRLGAVVGSNHYGDHYIQKWGAYAGEAVERGDGKGADLAYSGFGDDVLTHMREHDTLQAAMRFGRDGNGAVVYVHTDTLPDWVPVAGEARVVRTRDDGERQVLDAIEGRDSWTTTEIANSDGVDVSKRRVRQILDDLAEQGALAKGVCEADGRAVEWTDDGVDDLEDHVELPDVADPDAEGNSDESCGNSRIEHNYTWISATSATGAPGEQSQPGESATTPSEHATDGGISTGPPPG